jgi:hypothetical protein
MPINVTPLSGLSDRSINVRSHTGRGVDERTVTGGSLRFLVAQSVLHHYEKNESRGSGG